MCENESVNFSNQPLYCKYIWFSKSLLRRLWAIGNFVGLVFAWLGRFDIPDFMTISLF